MRKFGVPLLTIAVGVLIGFLIASPRAPEPVQAAAPGTGFAAIPGEKGGQEIFGAYEAVPDWPKPMSQLPGHEQWTWGSAEGIFPESPNRVFLCQSLRPREAHLGGGRHRPFDPQVLERRQTTGAHARDAV